MANFNIVIMRIGDISGNYTSSVLDRISNYAITGVAPVWGYNSMHHHLDNAANVPTYILFKPNNNGNLVGIASINHITSRNGNDQAAINAFNTANDWSGGNWDRCIHITQFWDLRNLPPHNDVFAHTTLLALGQTFNQSTFQSPKSDYSSKCKYICIAASSQ